MSNIPQALSKVGAVKSLKLLSQNSTTTTAASLKGGYLGSVISLIYTVKTFMLELVLFGPSNESDFLVLDEKCILYMWRLQTFIQALHLEDCLLQIVRLEPTTCLHVSICWHLKILRSYNPIR